MAKKLSKFLVRDRFVLPSADLDPVTIRLDFQSATLQILQQGDLQHSYAFTDPKGQNIAWAMQVSHAKNLDELLIGEAVFDRPELLVEAFPCTTSEMTFRITDEGHIGILDISDIGSNHYLHHLAILDAKDIARQRKVVFFFDLMPIVISLERGNWVVKTLLHVESDPFGPWYMIT